VDLIGQLLVAQTAVSHQRHEKGTINIIHAPASAFDHLMDRGGSTIMTRIQRQFASNEGLVRVILGGCLIILEA
jgi:hypothetical protein